MIIDEVDNPAFAGRGRQEVGFDGGDAWHCGEFGRERITAAVEPNPQADSEDAYSNDQKPGADRG